MANAGLARECIKLTHIEMPHFTSLTSTFTDRTSRVKDAKSEAQKEIDDYKKQKEEEFKKYEQEVWISELTSGLHKATPLTPKQQTSGNKKAEEDADKEAEEKLKEIKQLGQKGGDKVVQDLLHAVTDVRPEVPQRAL